MGKEQVMDYVMNSPENTNPAILGNMLDSMDGGSKVSDIFVVSGEATSPGTQQNPTILSNVSHTREEIYQAFIDGKMIFFNIHTMPPRYGVQVNTLYLTYIRDDYNMHFNTPGHKDELITINNSGEIEWHWYNMS